MSELLTFNETTSPIHFTDGALDEMRRIQQSEVIKEGQYIRIGVKGGGCSGLSYILEIDSLSTHDEVYSHEGFEYILDKRHRLYLEGTELHFAKGLDARGFEFKNPQASSTCGCGSSFSA
jgi:iron-sulfur cluster assembly protein